MKILTVYEINIYQALNFMVTCKMNTSPKIFNNIYKPKPPNKYAMRNQFLIEPKIKKQRLKNSVSKPVVYTYGIKLLFQTHVYLILSIYCHHLNVNSKPSS